MRGWNNAIASSKARRRAEEFFREEHHDAHAIVLNATSARIRHDKKAPGLLPGHATPFSLSRHMRIRIVKPIPAPLMDGIDVRGLRVEHVYEVDDRTGHYLVVAGYAMQLDDDDTPAPTTERPN